MTAATLLVMLGFGALALDVSLLLRARARTQLIADAASQSGIIALRQTADIDLALQAIHTVVDENTIAGGPAELLSVDFGRWVDTQTNPTFVSDWSVPNAVRLEVGRTAHGGVPMMLARIWGIDHKIVKATSTSASRSLQFIVVLDITGSWGERDFAEARKAALQAHTRLTRAASEEDEVAMTIFTNRYAWEYTPMTSAIDADAMAAIRADWELLNIASKAGVDSNPEDGRNCKLHRNERINDFSDPPGGCYPSMPREYRDESGTDHSTGVLLAKQIFEENQDGARYRAMLILTDGRPQGLSSRSGDQRQEAGYVETRWREYVGPIHRSSGQVRSAAIDATQDLWDELRVNTWVVSLVANDSLMQDMVQGDGYFVLTDDPEELQMLFAQIITEMPLSIVE